MGKPTIRKYLIVAALALSACAGRTPPPGIEVRTVTVDRPVAVNCVKVSAIPAEPERVADKLTGDARRDLDLVSASAIRLRSWGNELRAMLKGCAAG